MKKTLLLIIDMQNDFCTSEGALYVPGAEMDVRRLATFIRQWQQKIVDIWLTQDNHQPMDIAHPVFWKNLEGKHPAPFTEITLNQVRSGEWQPCIDREKVINYLMKLEENGEYNHTIWPEHCILGSEGAAIVSPVMESVKEWARQGNYFRVLGKGIYPLVEHWGIFKANVPCEDVPETLLNMRLIEELYTYDVIWMAGEAQSHCVAHSIKQLLDFPQIIEKLVLLEDCMSPVKGFEKLAFPIFKAAAAKGARFSTTTVLMSNF